MSIFAGIYYYDRSMGKTRYLHASKYLFGNIPAYCIELGKDIASFDDMSIRFLKRNYK